MRNAPLLRWLLLLAGVLIVSSAALAQVSVGISVHVGPPALPVYEQPACPGDGFIWIPGYWYWGPDGYFWVPGTWVIAPQVGFLWPPGRRRPNNPQPASSTLHRPHCNLSTNAPPATIEPCSRRQITEGPQLPLRLSRAYLADAMSWPHARRLRMAVPASARRLPPL